MREVQVAGGDGSQPHSYWLTSGIMRLIFNTFIKFSAKCYISMKRHSVSRYIYGLQLNYGIKKQWRELGKSSIVLLGKPLECPHTVNNAVVFKTGLQLVVLYNSGVSYRLFSTINKLCHPTKEHRILERRLLLQTNSNLQHLFIQLLCQHPMKHAFIINHCSAKWPEQLGREENYYIYCA